MVEIAFSSSFKRAFKKNIAGNAKDLWSFSVEYDVRVIFSFAEQDKVIFVDIGAHKEVY